MRKQHSRDSFSLQMYFGWIWTIWVDREFNSELNRPPSMHHTYFWKKDFFFSDCRYISTYICVTWERWRESCSLQMDFGWILIIWLDRKFNSQLNRPPPMRSTPFGKKGFSFSNCRYISTYMYILERWREKFSPPVYLG